ncbi:MAG: hypothetical protein HY894_05825 [Deltaproteobacteria bacterium]|nr:hypothetical protein [Deltaproteobacteria bacterium]
MGIFNAASKKKNIIIIIVLAVAWAGIIAFNYGIYFGPAKTPAQSTGKKTERLAKASVKEEPAQGAIRLDLLKKRRGASSGVVKDIFSPIKPDAPPPPPPSAPPPPPPKPPTPLETFANEVRFIGSLEKDAGKTIFISRGLDVYLIKKGDVIDGRFKVWDLTPATLVLRNASGGDEEVKIDMGKK